jgi:hypothetical protein
MVTTATKESATVLAMLGNLTEQRPLVQEKASDKLSEKISDTLSSKPLEKNDFEADVLVQLNANLAQLEDLHGRMRFMMGELSYLLKRS